MKSKLQLFSIILTSIFLAGCSTTGGHVVSGMYNSPHDNFAVPLPKLGMGTKVQEQSFENSGYVSFHDDFGSLRSIEYSRLPANAVIDYRHLIHRVVLPDIQSRFPGSTMLYEKPLNQGGQKEYFFVLQVPGGSPLVDMKANKALDSTRGYLYFLNSSHKCNFNH